MCRSIKVLREHELMADEDAIRSAALQYVRKVSGFRAPTARHAPAFEAAVDDVAEATRRLLASVTSQLAVRQRPSQASA
jgi:hypothetical protein